jgi:flagellin
MAIEAVNSIATNLTADRTGRILTENTLLLQKSLQRLSSGLRIVSPSDDPAGLAQSVKLETTLTRINAAQTVVANATSFSETQSGFLDEVEEALDRMSELATLSADTATTTAETRSEYQTEFAELQSFISNVGTKDFNGVSLFGTSSLLVVIDSDADTFTLQVTNFTQTGGSGGLLSSYNPATTTISSSASATTAVTTLETAMTNLGLMQAKIGAAISRLNLTAGVLSVESENLTSVNDLITTTDFATETTAYARLQLLVDSGTAMLSQSHNLPESLLSLIEDL